MTPWLPTLAERRDLRRLFAEGKTDPELAEHFGRSIGQIRSTRRDEGLKRPASHGRRPAPEWRANILDLAARHTDAEIAAMVGRHVKTVQAARIAAGIKRPNLGRPRVQIEAEPVPESRGGYKPAPIPIPDRYLPLMAAARKHGWSWRRIGEQWKVAPYRAKREVTRYMEGTNNAA